MENKSRTNFVFVCFGNDQTYYTQATYAICSLLAFATDPFSIYVATDCPSRFVHIADQIQLIELSRNRITEWKKPHNNPFRIKLSALRYVADRLNDHFVFLDTDVILLKPLDPFIKAIEPGTFGMYEPEFRLSEKLNLHRWRHFIAGLAGIDLSRKQGHMCRQVAGRTWQGIAVPKSQFMWNSGVFAIHKDDFGCLDLALRILDEINGSNIKFFTVEQLAISIACSHKGTIISAKNYFDHYWKKKEFMTNAITKKLNLDNFDLEDIVKGIQENPYINKSGDLLCHR